MWDERVKGAIGLLFEMNYFLGISVLIYAIYLVYGDDHPSERGLGEYENLYNFVYYQVIIFFIALGLCAAMLLFFIIVNSKMTLKGANTKITDI